MSSKKSTSYKKSKQVKANANASTTLVTTMISRLDLSNASSFSISTIPNLANITDLDLSHNASLLCIGALTKLQLKRLNISHTAVASTHNIQLLQLQWLDISNTSISDTHLINSSQVIIQLHASDSAINLRDITTPSLIFANVSNTNTRSFKLNTNMKLQVLYCANNSIDDLHGIELLHALTKLDLHNNNIQYVQELTRLTNLTDLDISGNQINDITATMQLKLKSLKLDNIKSTNITQANYMTLYHMNCLDWIKPSDPSNPVHQRTLAFIASCFKIKASQYPIIASIQCNLIHPVYLMTCNDLIKCATNMLLYIHADQDHLSCISDLNTVIDKHLATSTVDEMDALFDDVLGLVLNLCQSLNSNPIS